MIRHRLRDFFHPGIQGGMTWLRYVLLSAFLSIGLIVHDAGPGLEGAFFGNPSYAPPASVLHITSVRYVVHSQYWWDASSLQSTPIDDIDYIFDYGVQEPARLPGPSWATYQWVTAGYIPGSGFYSTWRTPNGGHIAWYHLTYSNYTARHGGDVIGETSWPTDPVYGNGTSGPYDAHMCISLDQAALWWFQVGIYHPPPPPPKPKPAFPITRWDSTVASYNSHHPRHRHALVSAYHRKALSRIAADWWRGGLNKHFGGPGDVAHWDARNRVMVEHFPGKVTVYEWSQLRGAPLKWERAGKIIRVSH